MVIVNLKGGLGNQLFQYAAGASIAKKLNTDFRMDHSFLNNTNIPGDFTVRKFELDVFGIEKNACTQEERERFMPRTSFTYRLKRKFFPFLIRHRYFAEPHLGYFPAVFFMGQNVYLDGYFQSEKYFSFNAAEIRRKLGFSKPLEGLNREVAQKAAHAASVSVHIRRTDYLSKDNAALFGGICTDEYYTRAFEAINSKISNPVYFVFSDDPEWTKQNISTGHETVYVSHNRGEDSYRDMQLMSLCRNNIIANSSFSWWGAWLNANPGKTVIAPAKWINDHRVNTADIVCESWLRM